MALRFLSAIPLLWFSAVLCAFEQNPATLPVPRSDGWWQSRHEEVLRRVKAMPDAQLVFVGDSITQNYEKTGPAPDEVFAPTWAEFFAPHKALNLGYSGDQTQHVLWRLAHGEVDGLAPENVVALIGTNNTASVTEPQTAEQVSAGVEAVVDSLHARLPIAKILVLEILPSAVSAEKSAKDAAVNAAVCGRYASAEYVRCLDLSALYVKDGVLDTTLFYDPRMVPAKLPLHPNSVGQDDGQDGGGGVVWGGAVGDSTGFSPLFVPINPPRASPQAGIKSRFQRDKDGLFPVPC